MQTSSNRIKLNLDSDSVVNVKGFIAPIEYTQRNYHVDWDELANLKAAEPEKQYPTSIFQAFLPSESVSVGECWQIEEEEGALTLLRQLSPNPQLELKIGGADSYGLWACLRAYNNEFAEILFRIHAEFVLEKGWLAPSQFAGHVVIDRVEKKVASFKMHVPDATLNFDVRWRIREGLRAADIGFCPQMELCAGKQDVLQDAKFTEAIPQAEALQALMLRFYKSARINWVSLEKALKMAPAQQKPIHAISISGPLFDESC